MERIPARPRGVVAGTHRRHRARPDMQRLPAEYREVLVLREQEDLSYREISEVASAPMGTVMSRLSRARSALRPMWLSSETEGADGL